MTGAIPDELVVAPEATAEIGYEQFGVNFLRQILHKDRIVRMVNEVLGDRIELGPIGAGPGRNVASISVVGIYGQATGEEIPGDLVSYRVFLPIDVDFDIDLRMDRLRFHAKVVVPLVMTMHTEAPVVIRWDIQVPAEDEVVLSLNTATRRGAVLQKVAGLEGELRRFLIKVVRTELAKDYVRRATHLDMVELMGPTWPAITAQFLPAGPEDRR